MPSQDNSLKFALMGAGISAGVADAIDAISGYLPMTNVALAAPTVAQLLNTNMRYQGPAPLYVDYKSDTVAMRARAPAVLIQTAIPMVMPSSGSMANNGVITLTTALDAILGPCYLYLPASSIYATSGGNPAGWYYAVMTSTTVGTVYNNTYTSGIPAIPATVAWVTTGPGAYTTLTAAVVAQTVSLPAGTLGINGLLRCHAAVSANNSAGAKTNVLSLGGVACRTGVITTSIGQAFTTHIANAGATNQQRALDGSFGDSALWTAVQLLAQDTTAALAVALSLQVAVATDWIYTQRLLVEVLPRN